MDYTVIDENENQAILPYPLYDLAKTIAIIRNNCEEWKINSDQISILGCSAGGHLCAAYSNIYHEETFLKSVNHSLEEIKVNACVLCYPVIDLTVGWPDTDERIRLITDTDKYVQLQNLVSKQTPPTFVWHTVSDNGVPALNTLLYSTALLKNGIDHECHTYHLGKHGLSLANKQSAKMFNNDYINEHVASWFGLAIKWLQEIYNI